MLLLANLTKMIRQSAKSDIAHIKALMKSVPGFWDKEWRNDVLERGINAANGLSFVWEQNDELLGFICAHDLGFRAYLSELIISEEARGRNIGQKLLERVEEELLARGCKLIISDVWKDAVGFYHELGWSPPDVVLLKKDIVKD
jgi:GNAT superfamily N-acetyltransferase